MRHAQRRTMRSAIAGRADSRERVRVRVEASRVDVVRISGVIHWNGGKTSFNSVTKGGKSFSIVLQSIPRLMSKYA